MHAAARLIYPSSKFDHVTPVLHQLHWLKVREWTDFKLAVLVYKCLHRLAPPYLIDELCRPADLEPRQRRRSASSSSLIVRRSRLSTVGDRAFPVAAARVWNNLPQHVTSPPCLHVFASRLKTHFFSVSFREQFWMYSACEVTSPLLDTLIDHLTYLLTYTLSLTLTTPNMYGTKITLTRNDHIFFYHATACSGLARHKNRTP